LGAGGRESIYALNLRQETFFLPQSWGLGGGNQFISLNLKRKA